mgnify:FL=1
MVASNTTAYATWDHEADFTTVISKSFDLLVGDILPDRMRLSARSVVIEILFRSRTAPGLHGGLELDRGQFLFTLYELAEKTGLTIQKLRTLIRWLEKVGFMTCESTNQTSIGTILYFDSYVADTINEPSEQIY